jgi:uncharacterized repeat protein (TIGR03803 family)
MRWKSCSRTMLVFAILAVSLVFEHSVWAGTNHATNDENVAFAVLYNFDARSGIAAGVIAQGRDGNMYSATGFGGTWNDGTVFKITPGGRLTVLHEFHSYNGSSGLTLGTDGNFYGATVYGGIGSGYGTVFKITPGGKTTLLYDFSGQDEDAYPDAPPIEATDGNLYGTAAGDFYGNGGEVYRMTTLGNKISLFHLDHQQGAALGDPLVQGADGNFYATASGGGNNDDCGSGGCGVILRITPKGKVTVLHDFDGGGDGFYPAAPLIEGGDGSFYGTVPQGGPDQWGVAFKITSGGKFTILHSFTGGSDGRFPTAALLLATDGNFYGTTEGGGSAKSGVIFKINPKGDFSVVYSFDGITSADPESALVQHTNGKLYGDTAVAGTYGYGTYFSLDLGLGPFVNLVSTSGKVGKSVGVLGQGFVGTTDVSFNGISAKFKVVSGTYLTATVPTGATTGFVTVATPGDKLKSNKQFRVTE